MHGFEVHSDESACRKKVRLGLEQVKICLFQHVLDIFRLGIEIYRLFHRCEYQLHLFSKSFFLLLYDKSGGNFLLTWLWNAAS